VEKRLDRYKSELISLEEISRLRKLKTIEKRENCYILIGKNKYLNCSSNDYIGIAGNNKLKEQFLNWCSDNTDLLDTTFSSSSSRLLSGNSSVYDEVEKIISGLYFKDDAIIFSSGYHLNSSFFQAMYKKGDLIIADKLVHASIIDGMKLSDAGHLRYRHLDYEHLRKTLRKERGNFNSVVIVSESIFSMDGDCADLKELSDIAIEFNSELFIDEAHAVNCVGKKGLGMCEAADCIEKIDYIAGTFGKGFGGVGAFLVCNKTVKQYLINKCRSFIFTTALPPIVISWIRFILSISPEMTKERECLKQNCDTLRNIFQNYGFKTIGEHHIVPLICGNDETALIYSEKMAEKGIFVPCVRPPTVPEGSSRLRFSVTSNFTDNDFNLIKQVLKEIAE
jgi:8-amino-7-oxononanoate synthase